MPYKDIEKRREASRRHYQKNKPAYKARAKEHNKVTASKVRAYILSHLRSNPCIDCGEPDPIVLEFDHMSHFDKRFNIGDSVSGNYSLNSVKSEIEKCEVRCANCHRRKTYRDFGRGYRG